MNASVLGALATATVFGVTHALEPDHVAGISSLTGRYGDSRLSALVGACFSLGHVALVVAWLAVGYLLLGQRSFPPIYETLGTLVVAGLLGALGAVTAVGGLRSVVHAHAHEHDDEGVHAHAHFHAPWSDHDHGEDAADHTRGADDHQDDHGADGDDAAHHDHGHGVVHYLKLGLVGALFTLSPPLSMIAFSATLFGEYGVSVVALAVGAYAVAITATMSAVGAGVGRLVDAVSVSPRTYGGVRALGGVLVAGFGLSLALEYVPALA